MKKIINALSGIKFTALSGIFLLISLILMLLRVKIILDPALITIIISGLPLLYTAVNKLYVQKQISSALLITLAMIASIAIGELFAAGEVAFIMAIGEILENLTVDKAKKSLKNLISLTPSQGRKITTDGNMIIEEMISAKEIIKGDLLRIFPGELIPVDGIIVLGEASINQAVITGESLPVEKITGDEVFCGTLNNSGSIDIKATKAGEDSTLQKLINLIKEAENKKAPMQRIVDIWAVWLVYAAVIIAIATFIVIWIIGLPLMTALNRAVTILVVFCPCALALATPASIAAAIGQATKNGVIIKSGEALEKMGKVNTVTFDKTGTLTFGKLEVCNIETFNNEITKDNLLLWAASAELKSEHPIGRAIAYYAKNKGVEIKEAQKFVMNAGKGLYAVFDQNTIYCGSEKYLIENNIKIDENANPVIKKLRKEGKAVILIGLNNKCKGVIALSDTIRPMSKNVINEFTNLGIKTVLLTGDNKNTAEYFAKQVEIKEVYADLLPENKVEKIIRMQKEDKFVCMTGDGINDAPALKTANVGVVMGAIGSDIAIDAADIALMNDDISKLPYLKKLSNATINLIKLNITLSMLINIVAITLSILGILNPITGALVHNAGSVLVVLNAVSLYNKKIV